MAVRILRKSSSSRSTVCWLALSPDRGEKFLWYFTCTQTLESQFGRILVEHTWCFGQSYLKKIILTFKPRCSLDIWTWNRCSKGMTSCERRRQFPVGCCLSFHLSYMQLMEYKYFASDFSEEQCDHSERCVTSLVACESAWSECSWQLKSLWKNWELVNETLEKLSMNAVVEM